MDRPVETLFSAFHFRAQWLTKYPTVLHSWDENRAELKAFFEYPPEIRRIIYIANVAVVYYTVVRKFIESKAPFPTDNSIRKVVYLSFKEIKAKWSIPARDWEKAYNQFSMLFADRLQA